MSRRASTGGKNKATRPRVYARVRPMFGRDAGQEELFTITDTSLEYQKEPGAAAWPSASGLYFLSLASVLSRARD